MLTLARSGDNDRLAEMIAAIQANQSAIIGYMTQEKKICELERKNAALSLQISQNVQTTTILDALKK